jgi:hypothetical protein
MAEVDAQSTTLDVLIVADSDSYVKWAVTRSLDMPSQWNKRVVVVRNAVTPSERQISAAVDGRLGTSRVDVVSFRQLADMIRQLRPDVLFLGARGPFIETLLDSTFKGRRVAPVVVAGIPGIWLPPTRLALRYRSSVDMFVVHSREERRLLQEMIPYGRLRTVGLASLVQVANPPQPSERSRVVFAPQALVPRTAEGRERLFAALIDTAAAHPEIDVVIKLRALVEEQQTHREFAAFPEIAESWPDPLPPNLIFGYGPLTDFFDGCIGFVTVSSTAVIEAISAGIPSICLSDYGISRKQINLAFEGAGLWGTLDDLRGLRFNEPSPQWMDDNYFHSEVDNDWVDLVASLASTSAVDVAEPVSDRRRPLRTRLVSRGQALGNEDSWPMHSLATATKALKIVYSKGRSQIQALKRSRLRQDY